MIKRAALHIPVGILTAILLHGAPVVGVMFAAGFMFYEVLEEWRIKDRSYQDVIGYLVGLAAAGVCFLTW